MARLIAVFDESELFLRMMSLVLGSEGYRVATARVGAGALDLIRARHPDLVVLDMGLRTEPAALALLKVLRGDPALADLPVIVCGMVDRNPRLAAKIGAEYGVALLGKPFEIPELLRLVAAQLGDVSYAAAPA